MSLKNNQEALYKDERYEEYNDLFCFIEPDEPLHEEGSLVLEYLEQLGIDFIAVAIDSELDEMCFFLGDTIDEFLEEENMQHETDFVDVQEGIEVLNQLIQNQEEIKDFRTFKEVFESLAL